ncbi:MAG: LamG-like jellyroll fold domain-containing protein, partial [Bacilli bacterium]
LRPASECVTDHCFKFDGEDDYIDFGDILRPSRTGHRTFSFWAKLNSFGGTVFSTGNLYHSKRGYSLFQPKNKSLVTFSYELHNSPYKIDLDCDMELNQWMFFIVSIKPNSPNITFYLYKDGILKDVRNEAMTDSTQIYTSFKVGVNNHGPSDSQVKEFLNGYVDDFKVFNAIFSEAQIKQNYIAGLDSLLSKASISKEDYNERINTLAYDN